MLVIFLRYVLERLVLSTCDEIKICKKRKLNLQRMSPYIIQRKRSFRFKQKMMQFLFLGRYRYELVIKQLILDITMKKVIPVTQ